MTRTRNRANDVALKQAASHDIIMQRRRCRWIPFKRPTSAHVRRWSCFACWRKRRRMCARAASHPWKIRFPLCGIVCSSENNNNQFALSAPVQGVFLCKPIKKDLLIKVKWKFQNIEFEKKGIRNQAAEQFKIERAAGQGGIWYRFRPVSVCLDKQLPRRNKYAGTC